MSSGESRRMRGASAGMTVMAGVVGGALQEGPTPLAEAEEIYDPHRALEQRI